MKLLLAILIFISFNSEIFSQPKIFHVRTDGDIRECGGLTAINPITENRLFVCGEISPDHLILIYGNSPALDAGSNELLPKGILYDLRGEPRFVGGTVEIGADAITFNKLLTDEGLIDIGLCLKDGERYTGEGELLRLILNHEYRDGSHIRSSLEDIWVIDENGLLLACDSNQLECVIGQREVTRLARGFILKRWRRL